MRLTFINKRRLALMLALLFLISSAIALLLFMRFQDERALARSTTLEGSRMNGFPKLFLWAWERPERLDFINTREVGVAFLAETIYLRGDEVIKRPRMQPLKIPQGTTLIAVVRIETGRDAQATLSNAQRAEVSEALLEAARAPNVSALQIDFDALVSERDFYKGLLKDVRERLPKATALSITALASWCMDDNWLDGLPIDEAVPMLFRMGIDDARVKGYLKDGGAFNSPLCRLSRGVSTDEPLPVASSSARRYVFNTEPWTERSVQSLIERNSR